MSLDAQVDYHRQFQEIVRGYVERLIIEFPKSAGNKWVVQCYRSAEAFATRFPTDQERAAILQELRNSQEMIADALSCCSPVFEAFQVEALPTPHILDN